MAGDDQLGDEELPKMCEVDRMFHGQQQLFHLPSQILLEAPRRVQVLELPGSENAVENIPLLLEGPKLLVGWEIVPIINVLLEEDTADAVVPIQLLILIES